MARYWAPGVGAVALVVVGCAAGMGAGGRTALILPSEHVSDAWADKGYVGPRARACHSQVYNYYRGHGHPKKLRPATEARECDVPLPEG